MSDMFTYADAVHAAKERAEHGIKQSALTAGWQWHEDALLIVKRYAEANPTLFADDIWPLLPDHPHGKESKRALGKVIRESSRNGWIVKQPAENGRPGDIVCRASSASNGSPKPVWSSCIYKQVSL